MRWIYLCVAALQIAAPASGAPPDVNAAGYTFELKLDSDLQQKIGPDIQKPNIQKIGAMSGVRYIWRNVEGDRVLTIESVGTKTMRDGKTVTEGTLSREKVVKVSEGKTTEITFDQAPEGLRKILSASYDAPLCKLRRDAQGKEIKRTIVALPEAKGMIENGMIANALLFHPPYYPKKSEWESDAEISIGNGGFAKGKLRYKRSESNKFNVSGKLGYGEFNNEALGITLKNGRYEVEGWQTYDPALDEWTAGKMNITIVYEMYIGAMKVGFGDGSMHLTFQRIKPEK